MHSSNLVLNDQFSSAYNSPNLVTVECEVPVSELTSGYRAQYAKDAVGWHSWHTGTIAGALRKATGIERQVLLSRWIKPVRIVPDTEVAQMYKALLDGTGVAVPDNVVPPGLLAELKKIGVPITKSGKVSSDVQFAKRNKVDNNEDNDYNTDGVRWVYDKSILTKQEQKQFHTALADISYRDYKAYPQTTDGEYIVWTERSLIFCNGNYKNPVISTIIRFQTTDPAESIAMVRSEIFEE